MKLSFAGRFPIGIYTCNIEHSSRELSVAINCKLPLYFFCHAGTLQTPDEKLSSFTFLSAAIFTSVWNCVHFQARYKSQSLSGNSISFSVGWYHFKSYNKFHFLHFPDYLQEQCIFYSGFVQKPRKVSATITQLRVKMVSDVTGQKPTRLYRSTFLIKPGGTDLFLHKIAQSKKQRTTSGRETLFPSFI